MKGVTMSRSGEHRREGRGNGGLAGTKTDGLASWRLVVDGLRRDGSVRGEFGQDRLSLRAKRQRLGYCWIVLKPWRVRVWRCVVLCSGDRRQERQERLRGRLSIGFDRR